MSEAFTPATETENYATSSNSTELTEGQSADRGLGKKLLVAGAVVGGAALVGHEIKEHEKHKHERENANN